MYINVSFNFWFSQWEEIANGIWICPYKLRSCVRDAKSKSNCARKLLLIFYKKEELKGKRLKELDEEIVDAVVRKFQGFFYLLCIGNYRTYII